MAIGRVASPRLSYRNKRKRTGKFRSGLGGLIIMASNNTPASTATTCSVKGHWVRPMLEEEEEEDLY